MTASRLQMWHIYRRCCGHSEAAQPSKTHPESHNVMNFCIVKSERVPKIISLFVKLKLLSFNLISTTLLQQISAKARSVRQLT